MVDDNEGTDEKLMEKKLLEEAEQTTNQVTSSQSIQQLSQRISSTFQHQVDIICRLDDRLHPQC